MNDRTDFDLREAERRGLIPAAPRSETKLLHDIMEEFEVDFPVETETDFTAD